MKVKQLDHLNLTVQSLDDSIAWYGRVFGFEKVEEGRRGGQPWAILKSGEALLCIYEGPTRKALDADALADAGLHGMNHFALRVTDRRGWLETLARERLEFTYESPVEYPHSTSWYVKDPTGYEIEVALWNNDQVDFA